jgi:hypothetical protein
MSGSEFAGSHEKRNRPSHGCIDTLRRIASTRRLSPRLLRRLPSSAGESKPSGSVRTDLRSDSRVIRHPKSMDTVDRWNSRGRPQGYLRFVSEYV